MNELIMSDFYRAAEYMTDGWRVSQIKLQNDDFYPQSPEVWIRLVPRKYRLIKRSKTIEQNRVYLFRKIIQKDPTAHLFRFTDVNLAMDPDDIKD